MVDVNKISNRLKNVFSDADKVEYFDICGGYWDVIYYRGDDVYVESFKLEDGKLKHFASMEYEYA